MVRRVTQTLVRLGVVIEHGGMVCVGVYGVDVQVKRAASREVER